MDRNESEIQLKSSWMDGRQDPLNFSLEVYSLFFCKNIGINSFQKTLFFI